MLTDAQIGQYHADGCLVLPGFKSADEIAALRQRALQLVEAFEPGDRQSVFTTHDQARTADAEFLASGDRIHCFFEEEAFDAEGRLTRPKAQAVNKIGHAMHDLDPVFERFSHGPALASLAADLGLARPLVWQSMLIFKPPGIGGEVKWHQDATFLDTTPCTVTGFWFALEDATRDNGCLWVQPGGHRGPLRERFVREGDAVRMEVLDRTPWPDEASAVALEVPAGTLVVFHGLLPHWSAPNRSDRSRMAYTLHATDAASAWSPANWLRRGPGLPPRGFQ
ncbi:phytanoyl-CoA dioxygenase family protein [Ideonella sp. A 288]|uniref:phytanoyl-CoA dioxygenase family protein n=1 Tax=Ideonella sp. A 288 TaxID=1962181 RepID=UPI000B4A6002|nr:phytanoyl-CoA dioxygenase family protein [Ideonella sp. A 288]